MALGNWVDPRRCYELLSGIIGIYVIYLGHGLIQQSILKEHYVNSSTEQKQQFTWPSGTLIFPCGFTWLGGALINYFTIPTQDRIAIPNRKSALCGLTVSISTLTYTYAIYLTNFPVVMMFKSCNLISVLLVGIMCSRVTDKKLKLGTKKLVVGVLITIGIILFKAFDPQAAKKQQKKTQIMGIVLLIFSLLADGFLPDFQAQIKTLYKPQPMQMLVQINKWVTIISFLYACCLFEVFDMFLFIIEHRLLALHLLMFSVFTLLGQMFVYRMIKQFKQHFVPFVITTRKIFTVGLSIFWYGHETNAWQITGLILVFSLVTFEFVSELVEQKRKNAQVQLKQVTTDLSLEQHDNSPKNRKKSEDMSAQQVTQKQKQQYAKRISSTDSPSSQAVGGQLIESQGNEFGQRD